MAKRASKKGNKPKKLDSVGWGFWLICFVLLYGPCWYLGYHYSYDDRRNGLLPWAVGFTLAAFGAGLLSFAVNYVLQTWQERARKRARKKAK